MERHGVIGFAILFNSGALGITAVVGVVVDEVVEDLLGFSDLLGEGEESGVSSADLAGDLDAGVLEIKDLLELGDGLEELGLQSGKEGDEILGGGRDGSGGGGGGGGRVEFFGEVGGVATVGGEPDGAVGGEVEELGGEGSHLGEDGLGTGERGEEGE